MKKDELEFRNIVNVMDSEFAEYLLPFDYQLLEKDGVTKINSFKFRKDYWSKPMEEVTINANANVGNTGDKKSFCNLVAESSAPVNKLSALALLRKYGNRRELNGDKLVKNIIDGNLYMHNLTLFDLPYCIGLSTYPLVFEGLNFGSLRSSPPKRPSSFVNQTIRWIQIASNHFAGATALTDFIQNYSYFTSMKPDYTVKERENDFQNLIHGVSDEIRYSTQSPFVNVSISSPDTIRYSMSNYMWGDKKIDNLMDEIMLNQSIYADFISKGQLYKGEPIGIPYRFPITTLVADPSFEKEYPEIWTKILTGNANLCHLNIFNSWSTQLKSLSMCCRLSPSIEDLLSLNVNNTFGSFLQVGSHAVCSINLPRIAYTSKNEDEFLEKVVEQCQNARNLLKIHREEILKRRLKYHYFFSNGYLNLKRNFFSTIGFVGLPNALEIMNMKVTEPSGLLFAKKIIQTMKNETVAYTKEDGNLYNIEEVPAESASGNLAFKDRIMYNGKYDYYDSQFVPLSYDTDLFDRLTIEGELQDTCTGGSMCHLNIDGKPPAETLNALTMKILTQTKVRQFAFNKGFTVCKNSHISQGLNKLCPTCGTEAQDYITRVVGYFTPVSAYNRAKQAEFKTRKWGNTISL
jgi:ribonucleoside-triphosphate reductase